MPNDKVIISQSILNDIANAIKTKTGMREQEKIKPINMANTISSISTELHLPITVNIAQSEHQTITVTPVNINNSSVSGTTVVPPTTVTLNATIVAEEGYTVGTLNQSSVTANWGDTVLFSATPATESTFNFTLPATTNQTITLSYTEPGESLVTRTSTSTTQVINMKYGTTWNATVIGDNGYDPGTLSASSGTINSDTIITITEATKSFNLTVIQPFGGTIYVNDQLIESGANITLLGGSNVQLKMITEDGFDFEGWGGV